MSPSNYKHTVLVTGGSSGIGFFCAKDIAESSPDTLVVVANRSAPQDPPPSNVEYLKLDLLSRESVRSLVSSWSHPPLSALVCNAALAPAGKPAYTPEGIETTFAANHVGHALLLFLLKDKALLEPDCRIVFVSSGTHDPKEFGSPSSPVWIGPDGVARAVDERLQDGMIRYPTSKLANVLFAYALARRAKSAGRNWAVNSYDPGFAPGGGSRLTRDQILPIRMIVTYIVPNLLWLLAWFGMVTSTPLKSGQALARLAVGDDAKEINGKYIQIYNEKPSSEESYDEAKQDALWDWTINELAVDGDEKRRFEKL